MTLFVLVSLAICFSVGPILSSTLTYIDIRNLLTEASVSKREYWWETIAGIVVGIGSIGMGITGIVAIATAAPPRDDMYYWLDGVIMCNLQIFTSSNLVRLLQIFISPRWALWATHLVAISTILDIVSAVTGKTTSSAYESALLARLAAASLLSSALSRKQLETHKNSGSEHDEYVRLLYTFIFANAAAAFVQLCGAIIVSSLSLAGRSTSTQLRQGIFIACTATQLLCYLPFHITRIWRRLIVPIGDQVRGLHYSPMD